MKRFVLGVGSVGICLIMHTAVSQTLEEVVVTAQKREQSLQDIPISVDAYSGQQLTSRGVSDLDDLSNVSPSFSINTGGGSGQSFIRGVGSNVLGGGTYASVANYVDGVYIPRGYSLVAGAGSLENMESVQILKGPQGTLYGRNATGGAVVITTRTPQPGEDFYGSVRATVGDFGMRKFSASIGGGLNDMWAASLGVSKGDADGFIENLGDGDDFDNEDSLQIRAKLAFAPTENAEFVLSARYNEDLQNQLSFQQVGHFDNFGAVGPFAGLNNPQVLYAGTVLSFIQGGVLAAGGTPADAAAAVGAAFPTVLAFAGGLQFPNEVGETYDNHVSAHSLGLMPREGIEDLTSGGYYEDTYVSLTGRFAFDAFDIVSISSFNDHIDSTTAEVLRADTPSLPDLTLLGFPAAFNQGNIGFSGIFESDAISQEVYLVSSDSDVEWIAGAYYFEEEGSTTLNGGAFSASQRVGENDWDTTSLSVYAEVTYPLTDTWKVTVGGRWTDEEYTIDDLLFGNPGVPNAGNLEQTDNQFTYNLKLTYAADTWLAYVGASSGFKSGSLNTPNPNAGRVASEEIQSIEAGFKSEFAEGRVRLNGSVFVYDWENIQLAVLETSSATTFLVDGVEAEITGLELEIEALATDNLTLFAGGMFLDHEYTTDALIPATSFSPSLMLPIEGNDLAQTANSNIVAGLEYLLPLGSSGDLAFNLSANFNSGFWIDQSNNFGSGGDEDDSFAVANASARFTNGDDKWSLSVWINNLTDEEYFRGGVEAAGGLAQMASAGRPRHYGLTVEYNL